MARLSEKNLLQSIREQLLDAHGAQSDKVAADRKSALDYYFQRPRGDEVEGGSTVVSGDVSAMVEAVLSQSMDAFSGDCIAEFAAYGLQDEDQAALESATVQHLIMGANNGVIQLTQAIKDALLVRNGWVKCWVDRRTQSLSRKLTNVTPEALASLLDAPPGYTVETTAYDAETGDATVRITTTQQTFRMEVVRPEDMRYLPTARLDDLQSEGFIAQWHVSPRSDLLDWGFPKSKVSQLPVYRYPTRLEEGLRKPGGTHGNVSGIDASRDLVEWYECYVLMDDDDDGRSERRRLVVAGRDCDVLLSNDPWHSVPYAVGTAIINPHELTGISLYDKLRQTQDVTTGLQRALLDNVEAINRPKLAALDGLVNQDDLDNQRVTGTIRVRMAAQDVNRAIMPLQIPDISPGLLMNLEYQRGIRTEMGGASLELATGQMQVADRVGSQGVDRMYSVMEQLAGLMTRTLADSLIRNMYLCAHRALRFDFEGPLPIKMGGRWIRQEPSTWPARDSAYVNVGASPGERSRRIEALTGLAQQMVVLAERGMDGILVSSEQYYQVMIDWAKAMGVVSPEKYLIDPRSPESQQAKQAKQADAQAQSEAQNMFLKQAVELEQLRTAMTKYVADTRLQFDYWKETLNAEIEEAKIVGAATSDLVKIAAAPAEREESPE